MTDFDTARKEQLRLKVEAERQKALLEEIERIQREVEPPVVEAARRRIAEEEQICQSELQAALSERHVAEETLRRQELDIIEQLKTVKRKRLELMKQREEEERIRAEALRRIEEEARSKEEEEKQEEKRQQLQTLYQRAAAAFDEKEYDKALKELSDLFVLDASHQEALALQQKIREAQGLEAKEVEISPKVVVPPAVKAARLKKPFPTKVLATAVAVIAVAIGGYFIFTLVTASLFKGNIRIAVLPLKGESEDESAVGDGLSQEIVEKLQYVDALTVMGSSSSTHLSERFADPLLASVRLGYPFVVRGTVSQSGDSYAVDVKLVDSIGTTLWSQTFQKSADQLSTLSGEIAQNIVSHFQAKIKAEIASAFKRASTNNGEAYRSYLKAKTLLHHPTEANLQKAIELLKRARQQDEGFAEALALSSLAYSIMYDRGIDRTENALQSAEEFTMKATMTGRTLPIVLLAKGRVALFKKRFSDALEDFDHCLQLAPLQSDAIEGKAVIMVQTGRYREAVKLLEEAYALNPRNENILRNLAFAHHLNGTPKEGIRYHELNLSVVDDSIAYLIGPIADAIPYHPDVLETYKERVKNAFDAHLKRQGKDLGASYRRARHLQFIVSPEALSALKAVESDLRRELATRPGNLEAMLYLALTMTRAGEYKEGSSLADKATKSVGGESATVLYRIAEVYAIQKKNEVYDVVRKAIAKDFRVHEVANGDFYNIREDDDFKKAIILPMK